MGQVEGDKAEGVNGGQAEEAVPSRACSFQNLQWNPRLRSLTIVLVSAKICEIHW